MKNILNFIIGLFNKAKITLKTKFAISVKFGLNLLGFNFNVSVSSYIALEKTNDDKQNTNHS